MPDIVHSSVFDEAIAEMRRRSKLALYQTDFDAWAWDVLRLRNYEKMREIIHDSLFAPKSRTLTKSGNGVGKSAGMAQAILWAGAVFEEGQTVSIISAPSIPQLQKVTFAYLKSYHGRVNNALTPASFRIPGHVDENLGWVSETPNGKIWLASGRKPPDQDAVSMFQGLRSQHGMTYVWFDEAGGMSKAMFTAAEAVQTGGESRFAGIGNPDNAGAEWQASFEDPLKMSEYNLHTISAYDTPVFTGERVYPHTAEGDAMEKTLLNALTSKRWVAHKTRIWATGGEIMPDYDFMDPEEPTKPDPRYFTRRSTAESPMKWDARGLSKVMGEFPGEGDTSFFPQAIINIAHDTVIKPDANIKPILGVDIARYGQDESVAFLNVGGHCRLIDSWAKLSTVESARRIHKLAVENGISEVRIDASGVGGGVFDQLKELEEFADRTYMVIGIDGGAKSTDPRRWNRARSENHDTLRTLMAAGKIDLDYDDTELRDQLLAVTYRFTQIGGAIQITPKDEMRTEMGGSPDRLDSLIYAVLDSSHLFLPEGEMQPGDIVLKDPYEMVTSAWWDGDNYPL